VIVEALEHFVLLGTFLGLVGFVTAWGARRAGEGSPRHLRPRTLARLYAAAIVLPPASAAWFVAVTLFPLLWLGEAAMEAAHPGLHRHHLLSSLTAKVEPLLGIATFVFLGGTILFLIISTVRSFVRVRFFAGRIAPVQSQHEGMAMACGEVPSGVKVVVVRTDYPLAFVWGFFRTNLVVSSGLLRTLPRGLRGVLAHEAAHHARRDNLARLVLYCCCHLSLAMPLARWILRWYAEQVELICDEAAAISTARPLEIAEALVLMQRGRGPGTLLPVAGDAGSAFGAGGRGNLEKRVRRLVTLAENLPPAAEAARLTRSFRRAALRLAGAFGATVAAAFLWMPLAFHTTAEAFLRFLIY
jgi:Zn-dependent protease with chaperone function